MTFLSHRRLFATETGLSSSTWRGRRGATSHSSEAMYNASPSHTSLLSNRVATALWKCHFCLCPFAWQFLISEPLARWKSSMSKGTGRWVLKKLQEPEQHAERQSIYNPGLLITPNSREGHLFPTSHQGTLHMQKRWKTSTLVTYSHAKMLTLCQLHVWTEKIKVLFQSIQED